MTPTIRYTYSPSTALRISHQYANTVPKGVELEIIPTQLGVKIFNLSALPTEIRLIIYGHALPKVAGMILLNDGVPTTLSEKDDFHKHLQLFCVSTQVRKDAFKAFHDQCEFHILGMDSLKGIMEHDLARLDLDSGNTCIPSFLRDVGMETMASVIRELWGAEYHGPTCCMTDLFGSMSWELQVLERACRKFVRCLQLTSFAFPNEPVNVATFESLVGKYQSQRQSLSARLALVASISDNGASAVELIHYFGPSHLNRWFVTWEEREL